jgi:hypothetical protein
MMIFYGENEKLTVVHLMYLYLHVFHKAFVQDLNLLEKKDFICSKNPYLHSLAVVPLFSSTVCTVNFIETRTQTERVFFSSEIMILQFSFCRKIRKVLFLSLILHTESRQKAFVFV